MKKDKPKYRQIIDAAVIVFAQNGFHQAQVSKIARQAGVADGTIYLYFKNKEDILISLFQEKMGNFIQAIQSQIALVQSASEKLLIMIEKHFEMLSKDYNFAIVTQLELRQSNLQLRLKINEVLKRYLIIVEQILQEGKGNGEFSENLDIRLARQMIFGTIDEISTTWVMNEEKFDLIESSSQIHSLILKGLSQK